MTSKNLTALLKEWTAGNRQAGEELLPLVYDELRLVARKYMQKERHDHTLQATALVHEAYLRLIENKDIDWRNRAQFFAIDWRNRAQFFAIAAREMRRILVDHARTRNADKRGSGDRKVSLDAATGVAVQQQDHDQELLALDRSLEALAQLDPDKARVVELRYFGGLSIEEAAAVLDVSVATVNRKWSLSKAWLFRELNRSLDPSPGSESKPHDP